MGWLGFIVLALLVTGGEVGWLRSLLGFLKWICMAVGVMQGLVLLMTMAGEAIPDEGRRVLLLVWTVANLGAFVAVRDAERRRAQLKERVSK